MEQWLFLTTAPIFRMSLNVFTLFPVNLVSSLNRIPSTISYRLAEYHCCWQVGSQQCKRYSGPNRNQSFSDMGSSALSICTAALPTWFFNVLLLHIQSCKNQHKMQRQSISFAVELCLGETRMYRFILSDIIPNSLPPQSLWAVSSAHPST